MAHGVDAARVAAEYRALRKAGWLARSAYNGAVTRARWAAAGGEIIDDSEADRSPHGDSGLRIRIVPDDCLGDLEGDYFYPKANPDIPRARLERERKEFWDRVARDGVFGIVGEYWDGEQWEHADSCWGFVGDDWRESGYLEDCQAATLDAWSRHLDNLARDLESERPDLYAMGASK